MDFESPDVEKDFPGLYASESGRKSNESDFSDGGEHEKPSKKDLLGRRKDKKEKKDRGYAALEGESSPEEDTDTKSPSKSKKTKSFKFPTKSKEKREKSRDKEKVLEEGVKQKDTKKEKEKEKEKKEKKEKEKKEKSKDKEKEEKSKFKLESKEKLKEEKKEKVKDDKKEKVKDEKVKVKDDKIKVKEKDKDKKDRKLTKVPSTVTAGVPFEEIFTLGVALPVFGVPLHLSVERSRCHDDARLPLVVRDSIDFLQAHGLKSPQIYRAEADKIKLQQLYKLYTDRGPTFPYHWDVPVACAILKTFISELPDSILTQELHSQFEHASVIAEPQREAAILKLVNKLPTSNYSMLAWLMRHFESVVSNEQSNHANIQTISSAMGSALNMSINLLTCLITKADKLFSEVTLSKYVPPLLSLPAGFGESAQEIALELRKQESLLSEVHAEMHAGFITSARDHALWEAQRIVTQLKVVVAIETYGMLVQLAMHCLYGQQTNIASKRKLRTIQKSVEPTSLPLQQSIDEKPQDEETKQIPQTQTTEITTTLPPEPEVISLETKPTEFVPNAFLNTPESPTEKPATEPIFEAEFEDNFDFKPSTQTPKIDAIDRPKSPETVKPKLTEKELKVLRLELENAEYLQLKSLLQAKINSEQFEIVKLRSHVALKSKQEGNQNSKDVKENNTPEDQELRQRLMKENALLEQKRMSLTNQIFQERVACVQLKIELAMKEILSKS